MSADTIVPDPANPQSLNRYSYTRNNPLRYRDPSGHGECDIAGNCRDDDALPPYPGLPTLVGNEIDILKGKTPLIFEDPLRPLPNPTPGRGFQAGHPGVDYPAAVDTPVYAPTLGLVVLTDQCALNDCNDLIGQFGVGDPEYAKINGGYGNVIITEVGYNSLPQEVREAYGLESGQSIFILSAHLNHPSSLTLGDVVYEETVVGLLGSTGNSSGDHLHTEIRVGNSSVLWASSLCTTECGGENAPAWNTWWGLQAVDPEDVWE